MTNAGADGFRSGNQICFSSAYIRKRSEYSAVLAVPRGVSEPQFGQPENADRCDLNAREKSWRVSERISPRAPRQSTRVLLAASGVALSVVV
jgi:hypothetical protein